MSDGASRGRAELAMAGHVASDATDDGALDASLGFRRRREGERRQAG